MKVAVSEVFGTQSGLCARSAPTSHLPQYVPPIRAVAAWAVRELSDGTLSELSKRLGRDLSTLSVGATRIARRLRDPEILQRVQHIRDRLPN
jgi:hypothetical protein